MVKALDWAALAAVHEFFRVPAFEIVAAGEELSPQLFLVQADERGRVKHFRAAPPVVMAAGFSSARGKAAFARMLVELATGSAPMAGGLFASLGFEPDLLVTINEVWTAAVTPEEMKTGEPAMPPSERSDRGEAVLVALHTAKLTIPVVHKIVNKPKRHAIQSPFPTESEAARSGGQMTVQDALGQRGPTH